MIKNILVRLNATKRLCCADTYLDNLKTEILKFDKDDLGVLFIPSSTIFHPKGGGQLADLGRAVIGSEGFTVIQLLESEKHVKHCINASESIIPKTKGKGIQLLIDLDGRKKYARLHSAGHIMASILESKYSTLSAIKGNHFPNTSAVVFTRNDIDEKGVKK